MLKTILAPKRTAILEKWHGLILGTYPAEVSRLLGDSKDPFSNPVGSTLRTSTAAILDGLIAGDPLDRLAPALGDIVRIRAVQDFAPSQAVAFVPLLRRAIREVAAAELGERGSAVSGDLDLLTEEMTARCFDLYVECREKIFQIRVNEIRNRTYKLVERVNRMGSAPLEFPGTDAAERDGALAPAPVAGVEERR